MKGVLHIPRYTVHERIFMVLWTLYSIIYVFLYASELQFMFPRLISIRAYPLFAVCVALICAILLSRTMSRRRFIISVMLGIIISCIELANHFADGAFAITFLFTIYAQSVDFKRMLRFDIALKTSLFCIIVALCMIGVIESYSVVSNGIYKRSLGFGNPNTMCCFFFTILIEWMCLHFKKLNAKNMLVLLALSLWMFNVGASRTSGYTFLFIYVLFIVAKWKPAVFYTRASTAVFTCVTPALTLLSYFSGTFYHKGNSLLVALNMLFSNRIAWIARFLDQYDITLFGQALEIRSTRMSQITDLQKTALDNAYMRILLGYGIIFLILFCLAYGLLFRKLIRQRRVEWALLSLYVVLSGLGEAYMLNIVYNVSFWLLLHEGFEERVPARTQQPANLGQTSRIPQRGGQPYFG